LTEQTRLPRASLYQRFGDKKGLFLASVEHYGRTRTNKVTAKLTATGDAAAELGAFFDALVDLVSGPDGARGCLVANVLGDAAGIDDAFRQILRRKVEILERKIHATLLADRHAISPCHLQEKASLLATMTRGLAVSARAGIPPSTLRTTAQTAVELVCGPDKTA